jgi:flagellar biosynthetic protein FliR
MFVAFEQWLAAEAFTMFLVFARVGMAIALLPGFGETYVSTRIRLLIAGSITFVLAPVLRPLLPPEPATPLQLLLLLVMEIGIGGFLGVIARLTLNALQTAGAVIGMQTSLSAAFAFDPSTAQQGALTASFLGAVALIVVFAADFHHLMIRALADSYILFPPGAALPIGDFTEAITRLVASSFALGIRISAPFLVFGLIFFLGLGLIARLMPQMQVFFVSQPAQIMIGLILFAGTLAAGVAAFLGSFEDSMAIFIAPPR